VRALALVRLTDAPTLTLLLENTNAYPHGGFFELILLVSPDGTQVLSYTRFRAVFNTQQLPSIRLWSTPLPNSKCPLRCRKVSGQACG
jgi:hypothetical protein